MLPEGKGATTGVYKRRVVPRGRGMADRYVLHCEGTVTFCTDGIPDGLLGCEEGERRFLYGWKDGTWGVSAEVSGGAATGSPGCGAVAGRFKMAVEVRQGDSELLKLQASSRLQERVSGNVRTIAVGTGGVPLDSLLEGKEVSAVLASPFNEGDCAQIVIRATNAHEFANGKIGAQAGGKPLIKLRPTALRHLPGFNEALKKISASVQDNLKCNNIGMPPGGEMFRAGISRWSASSLLPWLAPADRPRAAASSSPRLF